MNLHEYQAKQLLASYGLPVSKGIVAKSVDEAVQIVAKLAPAPWVVKAQIHSGGRGKGGGVKLVSSREEAASETKRLLGSRLVTYQTGKEGLPVNLVLIEESTAIDKELYLGAVIDRSSRRVVFMASSEGGVEIEKVAQDSPEKIFKETIDPLVGAQPYQARKFGYQLGLNDKQVKQFTQIFLGLAKLFHELDLSLLEINPLVITKNGDLICLDAKMNIDGNALFRQQALQAMYDPSQEDERERRAQEWQLSYVALDGNIGCMVNGAGLAMATMDIIKLKGGMPANFLDVGGGATKERVAEAFKIILSDSQVKAILINIFGGIVRCDLIAEGIMDAIKEVAVKIPVVVRLEGNNADKGMQMLSRSGLAITTANNLDEAAQRAVEASQ